MKFFHLALLLVTVALVIHATIFAAKHDFVKPVEYTKPFTLRYPRIFLWIAILFFALIGCFLLNMLIWQEFSIFGSILLGVLAVCSLPALLLALRWKIVVLEEYLLYTGMIGGKKQIYYKDIQGVTVTRKAVTLKTTLREIRFISGVYYMEDLLFRLRDNGVTIERFL